MTTANDASETFHFQAGGRKVNEAVLTLNVRDNSERVSVSVNDRGIGDIQPNFGVDPGTWQSQTVVFDADILRDLN